MQITCPSCRRIIPPGDINIQTAIAKCTVCSEVFSFAHQVHGSAPSAAPPPPPQGIQVTPATGGILGGIVQKLTGFMQPMQKSEVAMPNGFAMTQQIGTLVISRRWFSWGTIPLLLMALFWNGMMVVVVSQMLGSGQPFPYFILLHVAAGIFIGYLALANLLNTTEFQVSRHTLSVRHFPLWWPGNRTIGVAQIEQLFCEERRGRKGARSYAVGVEYKDGNRLTLVSNFNQPNEARFIEQEIEKRLGITDRLVPGEMYAP